MLEFFIGLLSVVVVISYFMTILRGMEFVGNRWSHPFLGPLIFAILSLIPIVNFIFFIWIILVRPKTLEGAVLQYKYDYWIVIYSVASLIMYFYAWHYHVVFTNFVLNAN